MAATLKNLIKSQENNHEKIMAILTGKIKKDKSFKKALKRLNNGEYDFLTSNNDDGVDYQVNFSLGSLKIDAPKELVRDALEMVLDGDSIYFNNKEDYLYLSQVDEAFIYTHSNKIAMNRDDLQEFKNEFHAFVLYEKWCNDHGEYRGLYTCDYYGNISEKKWSQDFNQHLAEYETPKRTEQLDLYSDLFDLMKNAEDGRTDLSNLPDKLYECLSQELKDIQWNNGVTIDEVVSIETDKLVLKFSLGNDVTLKETPEAKLVDAKYGTYELEIELINNVVKYILED